MLTKNKRFNYNKNGEINKREIRKHDNMKIEFEIYNKYIKRILDIIISIKILIILLPIVIVLIPVMYIIQGRPIFFLQKTCIDETPQFLNILKGDYEEYLDDIASNLGFTRDYLDKILSIPLLGQKNGIYRISIPIIRLRKGAYCTNKISCFIF